MATLPNIALRIPAMQRLPASGALNALMMAVQRQEVALASALQMVNA
jgi:hypothetical protein